MKRLLLSLGISIVSQVAVAQWTYILTTNGNGAITVEKFGPYSTKAECERDRLLDISGRNWSYYMDLGNGRGGTISVKATATPCTSPSGGAIGSVDILGVSKGSSFYSTNGVNEIHDWTNDYTERMLALNPNYKSNESNAINTDDPYYNNARNNYTLSGRMPDGSTKYIKNADLLKVIGQTNRIPGAFILSSNSMPITMMQPESGVYVPPIYDAYAKLLKSEEEKRQRELEWEQKEAKAWDEIRSKLDDENYHLLAYILKSNNGGERPKFLRVTDSGRYVFESSDGNNVFSVSKDANDINSLTFKEHSWNDDNIIKAIQEKSFKDVIDERFEFEIKGGKLDILEVENGKISFKDLENLSPDKLRKLLPQIKGEIKLKLIDNSSELSYEYMHLFDSHISAGGKLTLSSGIKDDIGGSATLTSEKAEKATMTSNGNDYYVGTTSTERNEIIKEKEKSEKWFGPLKIEGNAELKISSLEGTGKVGVVKKIGNNYFYCSGELNLEGGTRIDKNIISSKPSAQKRGSAGELALLIIYVKGDVGGIQCKNITNSIDNIPTLKK